MRDRKAYRDAGRNDPHSVEQKREHPYDFVSLPERATAGSAVGHDQYPPERWSGVLTLVYQTCSELHVGSGGFDQVARGAPIRGIVRRQGQPVLPGASWKGAVRSRFEAITASTLGVASTRHGNVWSKKLPGVLQGSGREPFTVEIKDRRPKPRQDQETRRQQGSDIAQLCPAQALFGAMGYRGRVRPGEGEIKGPAPTKPLTVVPQESPQPHRLAKPGRARPAVGSTIQVDEVEGRKFYYDGPVVKQRNHRTAEGREIHVACDEVDFVPEGSAITIQVHLENLTAAEVGALLIAAGAGSEVGVLRFGGYKAAGLGKVTLESYTGTLVSGRERRPWRPAPAAALDLGAAIAEGLRTLIDRDRLRELHRITTHRRDQEGAP
jgi:CRISPR/Cas system CSM-associated protein Csm3 (group 7 of RAMP superfamily)